MKIGIDISQLAYPNTGVANYLSSLVEKLVEDEENSYILFFSSLRRSLPSEFQRKIKKRNNVKIVKLKLPLSALDFMWNATHVIPIETFIGKVDCFISSDWVQPPSKSLRATIIYDMIVYKYPEETAEKIVRVQKRKLDWVRKECDIVFCISESTRKDIREILEIEDSKIKIIYPGF